MASTEKPLGIAVTKRGRERLALQTVVKDTGCDPNTLTYVEDQRSGTATVTDEGGVILGRFAW